MPSTSGSTLHAIASGDSVEGADPQNETRPQKTRRHRGVTERNRPLWLLIPGGLMMFAIIVVPLGLGAYISVLDLDQYTLRQWLSAPFIGAGNYIEAVTKSSLLNSLWISVSVALIATAAAIPLGIAAAVATQNRFPARGLMRAVFLIPYVLPSFVVATMWHTMFQPSGIIVNALGSVGISGGLWLNGPQSYWTLVFVETWASWPFIYLLTLSGLQSVDHEVHEASALDGALWWSKLRFVIFPYLKGPLALACIISVLKHINSFTLPFVLFGVPAPQDVQTLPFLTYITSFQSLRFGLSAGMAFFSLILVAIPLVFYLRVVKLDINEGDGK